MLILIKIIFSFMDHIINTRLPISRSIFKNFLQILKGKIIKSNSESKVLIQFPMGCSRRQCTPDLFIYFILLALYRSGRTLWELLMVLRALCVITSFVGMISGSLVSQDSSLFR